MLVPLEVKFYRKKSSDFPPSLQCQMNFGGRHSTFHNFSFVSSRSKKRTTYFMDFFMGADSTYIDCWIPVFLMGRITKTPLPLETHQILMAEVWHRGIDPIIHVDHVYRIGFQTANKFNSNVTTTQIATPIIFQIFQTTTLNWYRYSKSCTVYQHQQRHEDCFSPFFVGFLFRSLLGTRLVEHSHRSQLFSFKRTINKPDSHGEGAWQSWQILIILRVCQILIAKPWQYLYIYSSYIMF